MSNTPEYTTDVQNIITASINLERKNASQELLTILIISGLVIDIIVAVISYFLAENSIQPVKDAYESQKIFIANASHEIKTPLAAISANLEAADLKNNQWIKNVEIETEKLTVLNTGLLNLARTDLISTAKPPENANLKQLIQDELKTFLPRTKAKNESIVITKKLADATQKICATDFRELLLILLDNALKYCDQKIDIKLEPHELTIKNDGPLIPEKDLPHLFERFYQADKSSDGVGLGLSIAKSLAERNNWQLSAKISDNFNVFVLKY